MNRRGHSAHSRDRPRSRSRSRLPVEHSEPLLLKNIYVGFAPYINSAQVQEVEIEHVVAAGFPPKTLSGRLSSTEEEHINEQRHNFKFIVAILLYTYLSQLMILINNVITNDIAKKITYDASSHTDSAGDEIEAQEKRCFEILKTLDTLISKANTLSRDVPLFQGDDERFLRNIQQLIGLRPNYSALPVDLIEEMITHVKSTLTIKKINPSMDTIEYAISCLNFDIFYHCLTKPSRSRYSLFYSKLKTKHQGLTTNSYITELHKGIGSKSDRGRDRDSDSDSDSDHSFFLYFYENIHNIAYNVFYNHEYRLPLVCEEGKFNEMVGHLISETDLSLGEPIRGEDGVVEPVDNVFVEPSSQLTVTSESEGNTSSGYSTSPTAASESIVRSGVFATGDKSSWKRRHLVSRGGSSRTRRQRKKQTKRTRRRHNKRSGK